MQESAEVRERIVELGSSKRVETERRHRSDELAGAMGEGLETEGWRKREPGGGGRRTSRGRVLSTTRRPRAIRMGLVSEKRGVAGE